MSRLLPALALICLACAGLPTRGTVQPRKQAERATGDGSWTFRTIADAQSRDIVCNDGSPATYFVQQGRGSEAKNFVIYLEGGGSCHDVPSCRRRNRNQPERMRAARPSDTPGGRGILSDSASDNPDFADWSKAYIPYCSSDSWTGDASASPATGGFAFRGVPIIEAVVDELKDPKLDPHVQSGSRVLLAGGSAGAQGMRQNLDRVAAQLPDAAWVKGVGDGLVMPEPDREHQRGARDRSGFAERYQWAGTRMDDSCVAANPSSPWDCAEWGQIRRHVDTPFFTYMDLRDKNLGKKMNHDPRDVFDLLKGVDGVFSTDMGNHVAITSRDFASYEVSIDGRPHTYAEVLGNWVFDRQGPTRWVPRPR